MRGERALVYWLLDTRQRRSKGICQCTGKTLSEHVKPQRLGRIIIQPDIKILHVVVLNWWHKILITHLQWNWQSMDIWNTVFGDFFFQKEWEQTMKQVFWNPKSKICSYWTQRKCNTFNITSKKEPSCGRTTSEKLKKTKILLQLFLMILNDKRGSNNETRGSHYRSSNVLLAFSVRKVLQSKDRTYSLAYILNLWKRVTVCFWDCEMPQTFMLLV